MGEKREWKICPRSSPKSGLNRSEIENWELSATNILDSIYLKGLIVKPTIKISKSKKMSIIAKYSNVKNIIHTYGSI